MIGKIASLESSLGLTIMDARGARIRVQRTHAAFEEVRSMLAHSTEPSTVLMDRIKGMLADPLEMILGWCARMGHPLPRVPKPGDIDVNAWAPYLTRLMKTGGTPAVAVALARRVSSDATGLDLSNLCVHWAPANACARILYRRALPNGARAGDQVKDVHKTAGPWVGLVAVSDLSSPGSDQAGEVVQVSDRAASFEDVMGEPAILGLGTTYRVEEASESGWLANMSYDSLPRAIEDLKEIRDSGSEARLVNMITGCVINV